MRVQFFIFFAGIGASCLIETSIRSSLSKGPIMCPWMGLRGANHS